MTFGSLFTGCGTFDKGLEDAGMRNVWQCEIDEACNRVLARHWPNTPRCKDVKELHETNEFTRPMLICGGSPCQDLSVAGRRAGLAGERSGLFFEFARIVYEFLPDWVLFENVPGLLSSHQGADFAAVLEAFTGCSYQTPVDGWRNSGIATGPLYGVAWRVLDAQWFGVPQRRRRVFLVGCAGDWRSAAEVLFERDSLPWDSAPSRETRARIAASLTAGVSAGVGVNRPGRRREDDVNLAYTADDYQAGTFEECDTSRPITTSADRTRAAPIIANCLDAHMGMGGVDDNSAQANHLIAHTLRGEGHDASEDGTGRGVPLVAHALTATATATGRLDPNGETFIPIDMRQASRGGTMTNNRKEGSSGGAPGTGIGEDGDPSPTIATDHIPAVAYSVGAMHRGVGQGHNTTHIGGRTGVRRLLPIECERLQGLPDDWTRYGADGKELSDSARYHMIGNAGAVPVLNWIARRILATQKGKA